MKPTREEILNGSVGQGMFCPECNGEMEPFWRGVPMRIYGKCKVCKYACSGDFVSGFWAGVRSAKIGIMKEAGIWDQWKRENEEGS